MTKTNIGFAFSAALFAGPIAIIITKIFLAIIERLRG